MKNIEAPPISYPFTQEDQDRVEVAFTYHPPAGRQKEKYTSLRELAKHLAQEFYYLCPNSRERSLALTKLEESIMWANAAIAKNE